MVNGGQNGESKKTDSLDRLTNTAQSMLPTGLTLNDNQVETPIPPLLRGTLRDYQHIGTVFTSDLALWRLC